MVKYLNPIQYFGGEPGQPLHRVMAVNADGTPLGQEAVVAVETEPEPPTDPFEEGELRQAGLLSDSANTATDPECVVDADAEVTPIRPPRKGAVPPA
jgi:hypothetical protein